MNARQRQMPAPNRAAAGWTVGAPRRDTEGLPGTRRDLGGLLLQLQRSRGNQFVQRLVEGPATAPGLLALRGGPDLGLLAADEPAAAPVPGLVVGAAYDPAEAAADRIADTVADSWPAGAEPGVAGPARGPLIHRRAADGDPGGPLDGQTSHAVGAAQRAGGAPLRAATRSRLEAVLGTGLSGVRVHADATARDLCDTVRAHAFTVGQHVFFRRGLPDLGSAAGRDLLAHELAHVMQQSPPTVIRRTYLDGGENWIAGTTRRGLTGSVKGRSAALRRVDDAVLRVRVAYADGLLPRLSNNLQALLDRIAEWRGTRPARMRATEVNALEQEARSLAEKLGSWRGPLFKQKLEDHQAQLNRVQGWLNEGSRTNRDIRLRNAVDWVRRGKAKLFVLTETADREYRAKLLLRREPTDRDATYFPKPNGSGRGALGDGTAKTHRYNPADARDPTNVEVNKRVNGWNRKGYIAVTDIITDDDNNRDLFFQTLRHEVQHAADKHRGPELSEGVRTAGPGEKEFQKALRSYKTEYRAHHYQDGGFNAPIGGTTQARGLDWGSRQHEVFEHIRADYATIGAAVGGDQPTARQRDFIRAAHAYRNPDTEGFNKYNSARIDDLYRALSKVPRSTQGVLRPDVRAVLRAARMLDSSDVAYIRAGNVGTNTEEQAFMLREMIFDRLDGDALQAFRALLV